MPANKSRSTPVWMTEAMALPVEDTVQSMPAHVVLNEAGQLIALSREYWEPKIDPHTRKETLPGLSTAGSSRLPLRFIDETDALLAAAIEAVHERTKMVARPRDLSVAPRARALMQELLSQMEWHFAATPTSVEAARVEALRTEHRNGSQSMTALALRVEMVAQLYDDHFRAMRDLPGASATLGNDARSLASALRGIAAEGPAARPTMAQRTAIEHRDRLLSALRLRMQLIRAAARFVYRNRPDVAQLFTSAYERNRRAQTRARKAAKKTTEPANNKQPQPVPQPQPKPES